MPASPRAASAPALPTPTAKSGRRALLKSITAATVAIALPATAASLTPAALPARRQLRLDARLIELGDALKGRIARAADLGRKCSDVHQAAYISEPPCPELLEVRMGVDKPPLLEPHPKGRGWYVSIENERIVRAAAHPSMAPLYGDNAEAALEAAAEVVAWLDDWKNRRMAALKASAYPELNEEREAEDDALSELVDEIASMQAHSFEGLMVKLLAFAWCRGMHERPDWALNSEWLTDGMLSAIQEEEDETTDIRLATGVLRDALAIRHA